MISDSSNAVLSKALLAIAVFLGQQALSQTTVGIQPLGSYANGGIDQIGLAGLGVHVDIPLFEHKGRGSGQGTNIHLVYDSGYSNGQNPVGDLGWRVTSGTNTAGTVVVNQELREWQPLSCQPGVTRCSWGYWNYTYSFDFIDSSGFTHFMGESSSVQCYQGKSPDPCTNVNLDSGGWAYDNSGFLLEVNPGNPSPLPGVVLVIAPSGNTYSYTGQIMTDTNGNSGSYSTSPDGLSTTYTDDSNVPATISGGTYNSINYAQWTSRSPFYVKYSDTSGTPQTVTVNYGLQTVSYSCPPNQYGQFSFTQTVGLVQSVVYPDNTAYSFTYYADGALKSMQLPTGGTINYVGNEGLSATCSLGLPATMSRQTPDGATTYSQNITSMKDYVPATSTTTIAHPDGSWESVNFVYVLSQIAAISQNLSYETAHTWYSPSGAVLKSTMRCYNGATGDCTTTPITLPIAQIATTTTLDNGLASKNVQYMNTLGLTTEIDEYDFGASSPTRTTVTAYASLGNNISDRPSSVTTYNGSGTKVSQVTYGYDESGLTSTSGLPSHTSVSGSRGNLTSVHSWLNTTGGTLDSHWTYDDAGQIMAAQDPRQNWTNFGYDTATDACLTSTTPPTPSSGVSQATSATCDVNTGLPATATDANGVVTTYSYDGMLRLIGTSASQGGNSVASMTRSYSGSTLPETITTTVTATPSPNLVSTAILDGLGRTVTTVAPGGATTNTTYNSMGYVQSVSNPYFTTGDSTYGITSYLYDGLGRKTYQCQPDNSGTNSTNCSPSSSYQSWIYSGNTNTFRDEVGNQWKRTTDALGRLVQVLEPNGTSQSPSLETDYTYDTLGNLTCVEQHGGVSGTGCSASPSSDATSAWRVRRFTYDSLSRLLSAKNPETGQISYTYDFNGNLITKTDARNITITYGYDALNRLTGKTYSDSEPSVVYSYDAHQAGSYPTGNYGIGLRTGMTDASGSTNWTYDQMGRTWTESRTIGTLNKTIGTQYNLAGSVWKLAYPSGAVVEYTPNAAGRTVAVTDDTNGIQYAYNGMYAPQGAVQSVQLGYSSGIAAVTVSNQYDKRLQPAVLSAASPSATLMSLSYSFHLGSGDNGNVYTIANNKDTARSQTFTYDTLNRLTQAQAGGLWGTAISFDQWGNLTTATGVSGANLQAMSVTQQLNVANQFTSLGYGYDAAGNATSDGLTNGCGMASYSWNAEGQMTCGAGVIYTYDGNGARVEKSNGTLYWSGEAGNALAESDASGNLTSEYIFLNGKRIARRDFPSNIDVRFTNDSCSACSGNPVGGGDRNLAITSITIGSTTIPVTDPSVTWNGTGCNGISNDTLWLNCDGDMFVTTSSQSPNITINAYGSPDYNVYPHMQVYVNGALAGEFDVTGSSQAYSVNTVHYYLSDHLGSSNIIANSNGGIENESDYYPFGGEFAVTQSLPNHYKFTGKERDSESGNDYFGARYYGSSMGRLLSPDPEQPTPLHLLNPQRWNMYAYGLNNPLSFTDSDGRDAAAVNFSKEIAIVGHEGIMSVHSDGTVVYARFGPAGGSRPTGPGQVQSFTLTSKVQFDSNGRPTSDSLNAVKKELATTGPEKGQDPSSIRLNYFKTTSQETANLDQWIKQQQDASNQGKAPGYNVETSNCTMFCARGLVAGGVLDQNQANHASPAPNGFWRQLWELQLREPCARTEASDDKGNSTGWSGCQ